MRIVEDVLDLLKEDILCEGIEVEHFKKNLGMYDANIICYQFASEEDLKKYWNEAVNNVAIHIQSKVKKMIEAYNIYIFFFMPNNIDKSLVYEIEQDKYSSRKIVVNRVMPDSRQELEELVEEKLFSFVISPQEERSNSVKSRINEFSEDLLRIVDEIDSTNNISEEKIQEIVNILISEEGRK